METPVECYGLHWDGNVAWLVQGRGSTNLVGLKARSPFLQPRGRCNHLIPSTAPVPEVSHWNHFVRILADPLVQAMIPTPKGVGETAIFVETENQELGFYLATLSRLSSPINPIVKAAWMVKPKDLQAEMQSTNIQPYVITNLTAKHQALVDTVAELAPVSPRMFVLTGTPDLVVPPNIKRTQTQIGDEDLQELMTLPLENIGAAVLRRYARREEIEAPMESRQARRSRKIEERKKHQ